MFLLLVLQLFHWMVYLVLFISDSWDYSDYFITLPKSVSLLWWLAMLSILQCCCVDSVTSVHCLNVLFCGRTCCVSYQLVGSLELIAVVSFVQLCQTPWAWIKTCFLSSRLALVNAQVLSFTVGAVRPRTRLPCYRGCCVIFVCVKMSAAFQKPKIKIRAQTSVFSVLV